MHFPSIVHSKPTPALLNFPPNLSNSAFLINFPSLPQMHEVFYKLSHQNNNLYILSIQEHKTFICRTLILHIPSSPELSILIKGRKVILCQVNECEKYTVIHKVHSILIINRTLKHRNCCSKEWPSRFRLRYTYWKNVIHLKRFVLFPLNNKL